MYTRTLPALVLALTVAFVSSAMGNPLVRLAAAVSPLPGASPYDTIAKIRPGSDTNKNGINDADDIIRGGREEASRKPIYRSAYYKGGNPPPQEGVCTDLVWRAFATAGYDLKTLIDADIRKNSAAYPRAGKKPDPNIDYRRVPNQTVFFRRHGKTLSTKIIPGDRENLKQWQGGDIVVFANPDHIAILSDKRNDQGIPLILHNQGPWATEGDDFMAWYQRGIVGHFRFP